eukprot:Gb_12970 [translate_table: standard]
MVFLYAPSFIATSPCALRTTMTSLVFLASHSPVRRPDNSRPVATTIEPHALVLNCPDLPKTVRVASLQHGECLYKVALPTALSLAVGIPTQANWRGVGIHRKWRATYAVAAYIHLELSFKICAEADIQQEYVRPSIDDKVMKICGSSPFHRSRVLPIEVMAGPSGPLCVPLVSVWCFGVQTMVPWLRIPHEEYNGKCCGWRGQLISFSPREERSLNENSR